MPVVKLIVTSTRPVRNGRRVADALVPLLEEGTGMTVEVVDLREVELPMLDEPRQPSDGDYQQPHTQAWAETISSADGVVWLTPEYNGGFTAAAKNAIDCLFAEWRRKPTLVIGYGWGGGRRSVPMLMTILGNIKTSLIEPGVLMPFADHAPAEDGLITDPEAFVAPYRDLVLAGARSLADEISHASGRIGGLKPGLVRAAVRP